MVDLPNLGTLGEDARATLSLAVPVTWVRLYFYSSVTPNPLSFDQTLNVFYSVYSVFYRPLATRSKVGIAMVEILGKTGA